MTLMLLFRLTACKETLYATTQDLAQTRAELKNVQDCYQQLNDE